MITDDFQPEHEIFIPPTDHVGLPLTCGTSVVFDKMVDPFRLTSTPVYSAQSHIDIYASPQTRLPSTIESLTTPAALVTGSPFYNRYLNEVVSVTACQKGQTELMTGSIDYGMRTVRQGVTALSHMSTDFIVSGPSKAVSILDSVAKIEYLTTNSAWIRPGFEEAIAATFMASTVSVTSLDYFNKYSTIGLAPKMSENILTNHSIMAGTGYRLATDDNFMGTLSLGVSMIPTRVQAIDRLITQEQISNNGALNFMTPYSLAFKPEFDQLRGFGSGVFDATIKADYLTTPAGGYLHLDNTLTVTPNFQNRFEAFGEKILSKLNGGLHHAIDTETEIIEREGKVEYHFHVHINVTGNFNIIGNSNNQTNYLNGHK
jgi:hypothetical protein